MNKGEVNHELKIDLERMLEIKAGTKTHEVRVFDRNYQVGDVLLLRAFDRATNTFKDHGAVVHCVLVTVTNITSPGSYGLPANLGVMSISLIG